MCDDGDLALTQPIDLVDQDHDVDPALVQLAAKLGAHMVQRVTGRWALAQRVEPSRGRSAVAQQNVVGWGNAFGIPEQRLPKAFQLVGLLTVLALGARFERRHRFDKKGVNQAVARACQARVEPDDDGRRVVPLGELGNHIEAG